MMKSRSIYTHESERERVYIQCEVGIEIYVAKYLSKICSLSVFTQLLFVTQYIFVVLFLFIENIKLFNNCER